MKTIKVVAAIICDNMKEKNITSSLTIEKLKILETDLVALLQRK